MKDQSNVPQQPTPEIHVMYRQAQCLLHKSQPSQQMREFSVPEGSLPIKAPHSAGHVEKGKDPSIQTSDDVCRLAGALTRASMPAPSHVTVNGKKLS